MIFNIYNEKFQKKNQSYTVKQKLTLIDISKKTIICEDFNAHHSWWNSIRANELILWINRFDCKLINISNKKTYALHLDTSQFVFDLTFATSKIAENIVD